MRGKEQEIKPGSSGTTLGVMKVFPISLPSNFQAAAVLQKESFRKRSVSYMERSPPGGLLTAQHERPSVRTISHQKRG